MLSKYIKSLLDIHSRVIIPDLGAFMLKPENSSIYFNEFLRFNDGLLVDYISEQEHIEKSEAASKIKAFVNDTLQQLGSKKSVELSALGILYVDSNEKIQLRDPKFIPSETVSSVPAEDKRPPKQEKLPDPETKPEQRTEPKTLREEKVKTVSNDATPEKKVPAKKKKNEPSVNQIPTNIRTMKSNKRTIIFASMAVLLIMAGIAYYVFFYETGKNNPTQNITIGNDTTSGNAFAAKDSFLNPIKAENVESAKSIKKTKRTADNSVRSANSGKKYCLIAGTFSIESNAERMISKLKGIGYNADKFYNEKKNLYYVSIAYFDKLSTAMKEMNRIKNSDNTVTWIYQN